MDGSVVLVFFVVGYAFWVYSVSKSVDCICDLTVFVPISISRFVCEYTFFPEFFGDVCEVCIISSSAFINELGDLLIRRFVSNMIRFGVVFLVSV